MGVFANTVIDVVKGATDPLREQLDTLEQRIAVVDVQPQRRRGSAERLRPV